jgi:phosphate transport system protein
VGDSNPNQPSGSHLLELTLDAFRVAHRAAAAAGAGFASSSKECFAEVRAHERELDSLDRDIDDLVTTTITRVSEDEARTLLASMKLGIALERIGDLLLSFVNRAESAAAGMDHDDLRDLATMISQLVRMLSDIDAAFRTRSLDKAVQVLRSDTELDRLRNVITFRHLEPVEGSRRLDSFHVLFMAQALERAGDHVKNMAEEICHLVSGRTMRHVLRSFDRPVEQMFLDHLKSGG